MNARSNSRPSGPRESLYSGHGIYIITGGSGAHRGAYGSGSYARHDRIDGARDTSGACLGRKGPPAKSTDRVVLTGTVALGG